MTTASRTYLGCITPSKGNRFPDNHLTTVSQDCEWLRSTSRCWTVQQLDQVIVYDEKDEFPLVEVVDGSDVVGVLVQTRANSVEVSGHPNRLSARCKDIAEKLNGTFRKTRSKSGVDFTDPSLQMHVAIVESDLKTVRKLLKANLDPNDCYPPDPYADDGPGDDEPYGETFLITAAKLNEPRICELLVKSGALPNELVGDTKVPPLLAAAQRGAKDSFQALLALTDRRFHAAGRQLLKQSNLTEEQQILMGEIEWTLADGVDISRELAEHERQLSEIGRLDEVYGRILHMACSAAQVATVKFLLENDAKLELVDADGATALFQCCDHRVCRLMLEAGAKPNAKNSSKATPIMFIDWAKPLLLLLDHGAKATAKDMHGYGVVLSSARAFWQRKQRDATQFAKYRKAEDKVYAQVLKRLIEGKAKINQHLNGCGTTALMMLAQLDFAESIKVLLASSKKADIAAQNRDGKTALQLAPKTSTAAKLLKSAI
ncbi:MAG: ankyrin repeat domain-containing protein [Planctomycetota bacterium]